MLNALYIAATGLQAQKLQLDASANNFANLNTAAYKRQSVDFSSILDKAPAGRGLAAVSPPGALRDRLLHVDMAFGTVQATGRALDVAINGPGFLQLELPDGVIGYARGGSLQVNADGGLSLANGLPLKSDVRIPSTAVDVRVAADGTVTAVTVPGQPSSSMGRIEIATFSDPEVLEYHGDSVFIAADGTAEPGRSNPGEEGTATLVPGSLEGSNVSMTGEMVSLVLTQRIYELNARVVQVADEMLSLGNNLRRS